MTQIRFRGHPVAAPDWLMFFGPEERQLHWPLAIERRRREASVKRHGPMAIERRAFVLGHGR